MLKKIKGGCENENRCEKLVKTFLSSGLHKTLPDCKSCFDFLPDGNHKKVKNPAINIKIKLLVSLKPSC